MKFGILHLLWNFFCSKKHNLTMIWKPITMA